MHVHLVHVQLQDKVHFRLLCSVEAAASMVSPPVLGETFWYSNDTIRLLVLCFAGLFDTVRGTHTHRI